MVSVNIGIKQSLIAALLCLTMFSNFVVAEAQPQHPQETVREAVEEVLTAIKQREEELKSSPQLAYQLVDTHIIPHFDFAKMSKSVLGKHWRKANKEQRGQFTNEFKRLLIKTYSTAMLEYTDETIKFLPFRESRKKDQLARVAMEIVRPAGPSIPMTFSLYLNKQQSWMVYDVKIDGVSLVTSYRSSFASQIRKTGLDGLIQQLAEKNSKVTL